MLGGRGRSINRVRVGLEAEKLGADRVASGPEVRKDGGVRDVFLLLLLRWSFYAFDHLGEVLRGVFGEVFGGVLRVFLGVFGGVFGGVLRVFLEVFRKVFLGVFGVLFGEVCDIYKCYSYVFHLLVEMGGVFFESS